MAKEWKPRLGALGAFSDANVEFVRQEGFNSMVLQATPGTPLDALAATDAATAEALRASLNEIRKK